MVFEMLWSAMRYSGTGYFALHEVSLEQNAEHAHLAALVQQELNLFVT